MSTHDFDTKSHPFIAPEWGDGCQNFTDPSSAFPTMAAAQGGVLLRQIRNRQRPLREDSDAGGMADGSLQFIHEGRNIAGREQVCGADSIVAQAAVDEYFCLALDQGLDLGLPLLRIGLVRDDRQEVLRVLRPAQ